MSTRSRRSAFFAFAFLVACAAGFAQPATAAPAYLFTVITTGEAVQFAAAAASNDKISSVITVAPNSSSSLYVAVAKSYQLIFSLCGQTHTITWKARGTETTITFEGCSAYRLVGN